MKAAFNRLFDRFFPPYNDPTLTSDQLARKEAERKHFVFALFLVLGCMLLLPISGLIYFLLMKLGVVPWPY